MRLPTELFVPALMLTFALGGCGSVAPPPSRVPDARSAIGRLDATYADVTGVQGTAKLDYLGTKGRVRADVSILASGPARMRFAVTADVIGAAGIIASDGVKFEADDKGAGRFVVGPAKPCNIARITQVPLPLKELVPMLWGMRPHLEGPIVCDSITWSDDGHYVVMVSPHRPSTRDGALAHELHVAPWRSDWDLPWQKQRMRLLGVKGWAMAGGDGALVYQVTMKDHAPVSTAAAIVDPDGLNPDLPPSGPKVTLDLPRAIRVEVPSKKSDVVLTYEELFVNPPLVDRAFELVIPPGVPVEQSICE
jgi:hypothetical protein